LTLEDILLDFSRTNYSSSKAAKNASMAASGIPQDDFGRAVISRVYQWALSKAVKNGTIKTPPPDDFWAHEWLPPTQPSIDPLKDIQAFTYELACGTNTRSNFSAANGYDFTKLCIQNGKDQVLMKKHGLSTAIPVGSKGALDPEGSGNSAAAAPAEGAGATTGSGNTGTNNANKP